MKEDITKRPAQKLSVMLVTGFDPFGGEAINPSWEVVQRLPDVIGKFTLVKAQLPTSFKRGPKLLLSLAKKHQPSVIVSLGQAGGRAAITPERIAINVMDTRGFPDNDGYAPEDKPVSRSSADAQLASLPIKAMMSAVHAQALPSEISNSAGTFVCNTVMYTALDWANKNDAIAGFVHIPYLPQQVIGRNQPAMSLDDMVRGITAALLAIK